MSQSRRLPSWPPLRTCIENGPWKLHEEQAAFDRTDGRCYYCGKKADGKFGRRRHALNTCGKFPWDDWFDGNEHVVHPAAKFSTFRRQAREAAQRRGLSVVVEHAGQAVALRALLEVAA